MKTGFYPHLALDGIRKNKRLYVPYLLTCIGMILMTYLINYLKYADAIAALPGGNIIQEMMNIGVFVITFFAAIFLFYTNSFLIRRRKKEFGLYNILGMDKRNIGLIILWEAIFISLISMALGLIFGFALSKLAEIGFVKLMNGTITYSLSISRQGIIFTIIPFAIIFFLIFLNTLRQVRFANAISLIRSENSGEKAPKANWILGILGVILLATAYYLAVTIDNPIQALGIFFIAVILVIAATYFLMIAGSVLFCKILQRKKNYYYKPNHFVSISSMVYRMKRNGAGLASICILATMVLVMISATSALFIGSEDVFRQRYPRQITATFTNYSKVEGGISAINDTISAAADGVTEENRICYSTAAVPGMLEGDELIYDPKAAGDLNIGTYSSVHEVYLVSLEDYNRMMGQQETLNADEALVYSPRKTFKGDTIGFSGCSSYKVKALLKDCFMSPDMVMDIVPSLMIIVPDVSKAVYELNLSDGSSAVYHKYYYCFDTSLGEDQNIALYKKIAKACTDLTVDNSDGTYACRVECRADAHKDFYSIYGGIFYLCIILSIVFIFATVLIIYYKQVSEGYEDQSRFEIMQKVGMTKRDIRKSINSQLLTVFFLPLLGAGLHLCFAFPIIEKLLMLFQLQNRPLFICTSVGSYLIFGLFYVIVYRITTNAYYGIVSGARPED